MTMTVNELAADLGITARAIRFYESKGLLSPARDGHNGRIFTRRDRARLLLVLRGKALGFTLDEIHEYLDLYDADPTQRTQVAVLLEKVRARIAALESQKAALDQTLAELRDIEGQAEAALNQTEDTPA